MVNRKKSSNVQLKKKWWEFRLNRRDSCTCSSFRLSSHLNCDVAWISARVMHFFSLHLLLFWMYDWRKKFWVQEEYIRWHSKWRMHLEYHWYWNWKKMLFVLVSLPCLFCHPNGVSEWNRWLLMMQVTQTQAIELNYYKLPAEEAQVVCDQVWSEFHLSPVNEFIRPVRRRMDRMYPPLLFTVSSLNSRANLCICVYECMLVSLSLSFSFSFLDGLSLHWQVDTRGK